MAQSGLVPHRRACDHDPEQEQHDDGTDVDEHHRPCDKLSAEQQDKIAVSMAKRLGKEVSITTEIDSSLIAGAIVTAGDLVIDGSASGRMEKLTIALNK